MLLACIIRFIWSSSFLLEIHTEKIRSGNYPFALEGITTINSYFSIIELRLKNKGNDSCLYR